MLQNHLLAYQIDQGYLWPLASWLSSTPRARIDSSVRRCTPQPPHILGAVAHLVPASVEGLGDFLPGERARPAGQKQHIGSGHDASHRPRVRPRPLRHIFPAVHASHAIQQENQKVPQGTNKRISSFRSPDLNTAKVSSMSIACICKARSIKRRPVWVSSTIRLRRSLADVLRSSFWDSRRSAAAVIEPLVRSTFFPMVSSDLVEFPEGRDEHC